MANKGFKVFFGSRASESCPSSVVIPGRVCLKAALISSPALRAQSSVLGTIPTLGLEVAPVINHYQVTHFVDADFSAYQLQLLSSEVLLMDINLNSLTTQSLKVWMSYSLAFFLAFPKWEEVWGILPLRVNAVMTPYQQ